MTSTESCRCRQCKAACRTKPGYLVPEDLLALAAHREVERLGQLGEDGLIVASDGSHIKLMGVELRVPTIVPAQRKDGSCVFYDAAGNCGLHNSGAKPFGCRAFNACAPDDNESQALAVAGALTVLKDHLENGVYARVHRQLKADGLVAGPLAERNERYKKAIRNAYRKPRKKKGAPA